MLPWPLLPLRWHSSCAVPSSPPERTAGRGGGGVGGVGGGRCTDRQPLLWPVSARFYRNFSNHLKSHLYFRPRRNQGALAHSFSKYLLGIYCVPGPALASRDFKRSRTDTSPHSCELLFYQAPSRYLLSSRKLLRTEGGAKKAQALGGSQPAQPLPTGEVINNPNGRERCPRKPENSWSPTEVTAEPDLLQQVLAHRGTAAPVHRQRRESWGFQGSPCGGGVPGLEAGTLGSCCCCLKRRTVSTWHLWMAAISS